MSALQAQRIFAEAARESIRSRSRYYEPFENNPYFSSQHRPYAVTLTYKAARDEVTVDTFGSRFCSDLTQKLIGRNWNRFSKRYLFPFVQGFLEKGDSVGYHHHFTLWIHPSVHTRFLDFMGTERRIRENFSYVATARVAVPDDLRTWTDYSSAWGRNSDRIICWEPKEPVSQLLPTEEITYSAAEEVAAV